MPRKKQDPSPPFILGQQIREMITGSGDSHVKIRRLFVAYELHPDEWDVTPIALGNKVRMMMSSYTMENKQFTDYVNKSLEELGNKLT
jgi:hypothetical protein